MKERFTPYIYIPFLILFFYQSYGQQKVLKIVTVDSTSTLLLQDIRYQKIHLNENAILKSLDSVKKQIEEMGFVDYRLDSLMETPLPKPRLAPMPPLVPPQGGERPPLTPPQEGETSVESDTVYTAYFNLGKQIQKVRVYFSDEDISRKQLTAINGIVTSDYFEVKTESLSSTLQNIANTLEKSGNSFSQVSLKNISIDNDQYMKAELFVQKSASRKIDKIIVNGYSNFPKTYLKHHLDLEPGRVFSNQKLEIASSSINTLDFVSEIKPPEVLFTKDSTIVYLYLKKENANQFDGLIGFTSKETGKGLSLNGYLDLSLNNLFDSGESFNLIWKNNGNNRQLFNLDISIPYVFNSRLSPSVALNIYKQDSSFVNTRFNIGLPYHIDNKSSLGFLLQSESSSNLLTIEDSNIGDFNSIFYGLSYNYEKPNNHMLFKTKLNFYLEALMGIRKNKTKNNQTKIALETNYLWSLNFKNHVFLQNKSGIINSENLYNNELLRIGGTNSIRGFDEESILASIYSTLNIEYRYVTNNTSYLYSITDFGYVGLKDNNLSSQLYALGLGYAFASNLGFINLSYALGKATDTPFNFNNSRFHIKIVNFF